MALNLRFMGFTGVDDGVTNPEILQLFSMHYPWVEWGICLWPAREGQRRCPTKQYLEKLCKLNADTGGYMNLTGHLCGSRCAEIMDGDFEYVKHLTTLGFRRVQVNATVANNMVIDPNLYPDYARNILACIQAVPEIEWIIQCNTETKPIYDIILQQPSFPPNMSFLFDSSCGRGELLSVDSLPPPLVDRGIPCGYAGGIGPSTLRDVLAAVAAVAQGQAVWVDMESSMRVETTEVKSRETKEVFSIEKCFQCIQIGVELGLPVARLRPLTE